MMIKEAIEYAKKGWQIFPVHSVKDGKCSCGNPDCKSPGKHPRTANGFKDATCDENKIIEWWGQWPDANIGFAIPSGMIVIDVDPQHGGRETITALMEKHDFPSTLMSKTGGGGTHIFYYIPKDIKIKPGVNVLGPGVDIRSEGSYVLLPPSSHIKGSYKWRNQEEIQNAPGWLIEFLLLERKNEMVLDTNEQIPEGKRNTTLARYAGLFRRFGMTSDEIFQALLKINTMRCTPPLEDEEVRRIAISIARYKPEDDGEVKEGDYGHAVVLAEYFNKKVRWATHMGKWFIWNGQVWRECPEERVIKMASDTLRQHYIGLLASVNDKETIKWLTNRIHDTTIHARVSGALSFLKGWEGIMTLQHEWDRDPWLLNLLNGTLDLRTGKLIPHDPDNLITKLATVSYDPEVKGEKWEQHIRMFLPNDNIRREVQRSLGMSLPGMILEERLDIWYGSGANGKTTTARVIMKILGDYAKRGAPDLLIDTKHDKHPTEIADLCGARIVFTTEVEQGRKLAESLVKDLTGGDRKKARYMRQDFFEFEQTFSIFLITNHKPIVRGVDEGIWRRIRLIPWDVKVDEKKRKPQEEVITSLLSEGSAILNWLIDGLKDWLNENFWIAPEVKLATQLYRGEMDVLSGFLQECCVFDPKRKVTANQLYERYQEWCSTNDEEPVSKKVFGKMLAARGIEVKRSHSVRYYAGISLKREDEISGLSEFGEEEFYNQKKIIDPEDTSHLALSSNERGPSGSVSSHNSCISSLIEIMGSDGPSWTPVQKCTIEEGKNDNIENSTENEIEDDKEDLATLLQLFVALVNTRKDMIERSEFVSEAQRLGYSAGYINKILERLIYDGKITTIGTKMCLRISHGI